MRRTEHLCGAWGDLAFIYRLRALGDGPGGDGPGERGDFRRPEREPRFDDSPFSHYGSNGAVGGS